MAQHTKWSTAVIIYCISSFISVIECRAQYQSKFQRLGTEDGLSENVVYAIAQDHQGYLWVGTWDGLNRYDGYSFKKFFHDPLDTFSLPGNTINCIYEDPQQQLWVGTNGGLCLYDRLSSKFLRIKKLGALEKYSVVSMTRIDQSTFIVHTGAALFLFDAQSLTARSVSLKNDGVVVPHASNSSFTRNSEHKLYTTYSQKSGLELYLFNQHDLSFHMQDKSCVKLPKEYEGASAMHIAYDGKGRLWMVIDKEKVLVFDQNGNILDISNRGLLRKHLIVQCLYPARDGSMWIGTEEGLLLYDEESNDVLRFSATADPNSPGSPVINCIFEDQSGVVWAGTLNGLNKLLPASKKFRHVSTTSDYDKRLHNDFVLGLYNEPNNTIRVQYISGVKHFSRIDLLDHTTKHYSKHGYSLQQYLSEIIVDGSPASFTNSKSRFITSILKQVHNLNIFFPPKLITGTGWRMWYADYSSFGYYDVDDNGNYFQRKIRECSGEVYDIQLHDQHLWVATATEGLLSFNIETNQVDQYVLNITDLHSIRSNEVLCFLKANDGNLWVGTKGGGLNHLDVGSRKFTYYTTANGLCNNTIYCMVADNQGFLWLGTSNGLSRFDPVDKKFRNYFRSDGLINSEFNRYSAIKTNDGRLFFGGMNGIDYFLPSEIVDNREPSPVMITDVKVFNKSADLRSLPHLSHEDNYVGFEFATMDFRNPSVNKFAYKLEGVDKDWVEIEKRNFVGYAGLRPGNYKFLLKGANSDGVWSEVPTTMSFYIATPWFRQWWFYSLIVVATASVLYWLYTFRIRQLKKIMLLRTKISRDLHDEVGATLTSISYLSEVAKKQLHQVAEPVTVIDKIGEYSRNMIAEMNDIVWAINPANDKFDKILDRMQNFASPLLTLRNIEFNFAADDSLRNTALSMQQRKNLYLVFKEAINNAVKYAGATSIEVRIKRTHHSISMEICDNGSGFNATITNNGNGLGNMKGRINEINGKFFIGSFEGRGTQIHAEIPLTKNAD